MCDFRLFIIAICLAAGCSSGPDKRQAAAAPPLPTGPKKAPAEPVADRAFAGTIILVNASARTVVLSCPIGRVPPLGTRMTLYRQGLKVGQIKVTGPVMDYNIVADLLEGEAQMQDLARQE